eukprot:m51a1_g2654 hypothetical protein (193) ;mRNA; r:628673-629442
MFANVALCTPNVSVASRAVLEHAGVAIVDIPNSPGHRNFLPFPADRVSHLSKLEIWRMPERLQGRRVLFADADVTFLRDPSELFALPGEFYAARDDWASCTEMAVNQLNSGFILFRPRVAHYRGLNALLNRTHSKQFSGDQEIINMYFKEVFSNISGHLFTGNVVSMAFMIEVCPKAYNSYENLMAVHHASG